MRIDFLVLLQNDCMWSMSQEKDFFTCCKEKITVLEAVYNKLDML